MQSDFFTLVCWGVMAAAAIAMMMRRPVHAVLVFVVSLVGLAVIYLQLRAEFVAFAQILISVGAVAILVVFTLLLTRNGGAEAELKRTAGSAIVGLAMAGLVMGCIGICVLASSAVETSGAVTPATVRQIGEALMTQYILPLEVLGLLLTAALMGAVILAMDPARRHNERKP
ncbi:MAG TPA: NADH-quinone oxidoreductase subunit J [Candidatus Paceibacterota bacterium]|nr:NADH-quinone oxidoreductase subunit J [Verrucomicrobiota bacterium]HRY48754.1 NADH-quinone oxidoreductase subunit J [Candidatus Paceibacterota bacterium]HRZ99999.1 NADH-quinone oxidoreductase subunit J [Candidatus Paceibacterota bacterium]